MHAMPCAMRAHAACSRNEAHGHRAAMRSTHACSELSDADLGVVLGKCSRGLQHLGLAGTQAGQCTLLQLGSQVRACGMCVQVQIRSVRVFASMHVCVFVC